MRTSTLRGRRPPSAREAGAWDSDGDMTAAVILGCARFTMARWSRGEATSIATIHAALDAGVRHLDTADSYGDDRESAHGNERLIATALATWRGGDPDDVLVATKGGRFRG